MAVLINLFYRFNGGIDTLSDSRTRSNLCMIRCLEISRINMYTSFPFAFLKTLKRVQNSCEKRVTAILISSTRAVILISMGRVLYE